MDKFGEDVVKLKQTLYNKIADAVETFKMETGVSPSSITVRMAELTRMAGGNREYVVDGVSLEFKL